MSLSNECSWSIPWQSQALTCQTGQLHSQSATPTPGVSGILGWGRRGPRTPGTLIPCFFPGSLGTLCTWALSPPHPRAPRSSPVGLWSSVQASLITASGVTGMGRPVVEEGTIVAPLGYQWGNWVQRRKRERSLPWFSPTSLPFLSMVLSISCLVVPMGRQSCISPY